MSDQPRSKFFLDRILGARAPEDVLVDFKGRKTRVRDLAGMSVLPTRAALAGARVMLALTEPDTCALSLIDLDGVAGRIVVCPPGLPLEHLKAISAQAEIDAIITDAKFPFHGEFAPEIVVQEISGLTHPRETTVFESRQTEWVLLTSGTTGVPKLVSHTFATLTVNIRRPDTAGAPIIWASFNDMRRFSGLQMFLHAMLTDSTLVLKPAAMSVNDFLPLLEGSRATHVSGTPTHWRKVLMFTGRRNLKLQQVTLVGEIADQAILDALRQAFPAARLTHIYGSTEAGTGFSVHDGKYGFPAEFVGRDLKGLHLRVDSTGMLSMKSNRSALNYVGSSDQVLRAGDGFVETGDQVELVGDRYRFLGRKNGAVNIGGSRVHPEEVEAMLNADPRVGMSAVSARKNPFTGSILVADVVIARGAGVTDTAGFATELRAMLRNNLDAYKVPATIRFVDDLQLSSAGKLDRRSA